MQLCLAVSRGKSGGVGHALWSVQAMKQPLAAAKQGSERQELSPSRLRTEMGPGAGNKLPPESAAPKRWRHSHPPTGAAATMAWLPVMNGASPAPWLACPLHRELVKKVLLGVARLIRTVSVSHILIVYAGRDCMQSARARTTIQTTPSCNGSGRGSRGVLNAVSVLVTPLVRAQSQVDWNNLLSASSH